MIWIFKTVMLWILGYSQMVYLVDVVFTAGLILAIILVVILEWKTKPYGH